MIGGYWGWFDLFGLFFRRFLVVCFVILLCIFFEEVFEKFGLVLLILVVFDFDYFKVFNDQFGYIEGDWVFKVVECLFLGSLLSGSVVGCIGGDEYVVILFEIVVEIVLIFFDEVIWYFQIYCDLQWLRGLGLSVGFVVWFVYVSEYVEFYCVVDEVLLCVKCEGCSWVCIYVELKMVLKLNYYLKSQFECFVKFLVVFGCIEVSLLCEVFDDLIEKYWGEL